MTLKGLDFAKSQTDKFHEVFGHPISKTPTVLTSEQVQTRVNFIAEELVEALAAVSEDTHELWERINKLMEAIEGAEQKSIDNSDINAENKLVALSDAFTDVNYFVQGTFTMMGVQPQPLFDIVQEANMAKLGPDGKPIYRESDGKIMKPEGWTENYAPEPRLVKEIERQIKIAEVK